MASTPVYILGMLAPNTGSRYFAMCLMPVVSGKSLSFLCSSQLIQPGAPFPRRCGPTHNALEQHPVPADICSVFL